MGLSKVDSDTGLYQIIVQLRAATDDVLVLWATTNNALVLRATTDLYLVALPVVLHNDLGRYQRFVFS